MGTVDEFLHRCVLLGDGLTAERLLRADENRLRVAPPLLELCARLKYPETCTATLAQAHRPVGQWMYECVTCGQIICAVCRDSCHAHCAWEATPLAPAAQPAGAADHPPSAPISAPLHELRSLGFVASAACTCHKQACRAIGSIDPREAAGLTWVPNPIDTRGASSLNLAPGSELGILVDKLAWNSHEV
jgi:hypothetical protein